MESARHLANARTTQAPDLINRKNLHCRDHALAGIVATIAHAQRIDEFAVSSWSENRQFNRKIQNRYLFQVLLLAISGQPTTIS
jgi:hypothetical protein